MFQASVRCSQLPAAAAWLMVCLIVTVRASTPCDKPCFDNNAFPVTLPTGLTAGMFNRFACLVDPSLDCRLSHEFTSRPAGEVGFPANSWTGTAYCPSCFLYFKFCAQQDGSKNTGTLKFVNNKKSPTSPKEHALVMPNQPCRGVEAWQRSTCGGETAWDAAFDTYTAAGGNPKSYFGYVMAVNAMKRRTQNQLHLHVGLLVSGVKSALQAGHTWAKSQKTNSFLVACTKPSNTDITCKFDAKKQSPADNTIAVTIAAGATPSAAKPFNTVYGANKMPPSDATVDNSMGVVASADKEWLILQLLSGAAECLLADPDSQSDRDCSVRQQRRTATTAAAEGVGAVDAAGAAVDDIDSSSTSSNVPGRRLKF